MSIKTNFECLAGANCAILCGVRESRAYVNGVAGAVDGLKYEIVCFGNDFEKISVKVPGGTTPPIALEELAARNAAKDYVYCAFEGFSAKVYQGFGEDKSMRVSATAKKLNLLPGAGGNK